MTFVLIMSSVTMVSSCRRWTPNEDKLSSNLVYVSYHVIGGLIFVGSQAWEWAYIY